MTPFLSQILNPPGDSGLVKNKQSKGSQQLQQVFDVIEKDFPMAEVQDLKEFIKVSDECEVLKATMTPIISQQDLKLDVRGQISVTEASKMRDSWSTTNKASLETVVIVKDPCKDLNVQAGKDRTLDSSGLRQVRKSVESPLTGNELIDETTAKTKSSAATLAMGPIKNREEVQSEEHLQAENLRDHDTEQLSVLSLVKSSKAEENLVIAKANFKEQNVDFFPVLEISSQNTQEVKIKDKTSTESKRDSQPLEKILVKKHEVTDKSKPDTVTDKELSEIGKVQAIKPKNSVTDIEPKHKKKTETTDITEHKEAGDLKETREIREPKETREPFKTGVLIKSEEIGESRQVREPSKTRDLEEFKTPKETKELTESRAVSPQKGDVVKTEEVFLKDAIETESTEKRRIPLKTTERGTETLSITIAIYTLSLDYLLRS